MSVLPTVNRAAAGQLKRECFFATLYRVALATSLQRESADAAFVEYFIKSRPHLFLPIPLNTPNWSSLHGTPHSAMTPR